MPGAGHRFSEHEDDIAAHIIAGEKKRGKSEEEAKRIAYATINARKGMKKVADLAVPMADDLFDEAIVKFVSAKAREKYGTVETGDEHEAIGFPMPDKVHARDALARINESDLSAGQKAEVREIVLDSFSPVGLVSIEAPAPMPMT